MAARLVTRLVVVVAFLTLVFIAGAAGAAQEFPTFSSHVVDQAAVVPDDAERQVDASLADYQARTGNQIAVAVVRTTGGRPVEEYSLALARSWGVGRQGTDNGVLILIAVDDRAVRIEVGLGLESILTDERAAAIVNDGLVQRLRQGDMGAAVVFATDAVRRTLGDATTAASDPVAAPVATDAPRTAPLPVSPDVAPSPYDEPDGPFGPGDFGDPGSGFPAWIFVLIPVMGVLGMVSSLGNSRRTGFRNRGPLFWGNSYRPGSNWGPDFGSGGHSDHASGGGSSGGFSGGGGGSFGGGGASGSW